MANEWPIALSDERIEELIAAVQKMPLKGRYVIIKPALSLRKALYLCTGGFGCDPALRGSAVFAEHFSTKNVVRVDRYDVGRLADEQEIAYAEKHLRPLQQYIADCGKSAHDLHGMVEKVTEEMTNRLKELGLGAQIDFLHEEDIADSDILEYLGLDPQ